MFASKKHDLDFEERTLIDSILLDLLVFCRELEWLVFG